MTDICWSWQTGVGQILTGNCWYLRKTANDGCLLVISFERSADIHRHLLLFSKDSQWQMFAGIDKLNFARYCHAITVIWQRQPMTDVCWYWQTWLCKILTGNNWYFIKTANDRRLLVLTKLTLQDIHRQYLRFDKDSRWQTFASCNHLLRKCHHFY